MIFDLLKRKPTPGNPSPLRLVERFCINCRHYVRKAIGDGTEDLCTKVGKVDPVSGQKIHYWCYAVRDVDGDCGPNGDLFEPKEQP